MLFLLRMLAMGVHFILAGILGLLLGLCRPFNPDNSRLCARLYSVPAQWLLRWKLKTDVHTLEHQHSCVIIANHQSNYDLYVLGRVVPKRTVSIGKKSLKWVPFFGQLYWLAGKVLLPFKKGAFQMAIAAGVPIIPVCVSTYVNHIQLNRWNSGEIMIRSLPAIPTAGLSQDDLPQLVETCRTQMQHCIEAMDQQLSQSA